MSQFGHLIEQIAFQPYRLGLARRYRWRRGMAARFGKALDQRQRFSFEKMIRTSAPSVAQGFDNMGQLGKPRRYCASTQCRYACGLPVPDVPPDLEQGQRQIIDAVITRIFQHRNGDISVRPRQPGNQDNLHFSVPGRSLLLAHHELPTGLMPRLFRMRLRTATSTSTASCDRLRRVCTFGIATPRMQVSVE